jgi:hypothetical protein
MRILIKFAAENAALGITQLGMTATVSTILSKVTAALQTGSLYNAMDQVRLIPAESKDAIFVTDARLLSFINSIEEYLGKALSVAL